MILKLAYGKDVGERSWWLSNDVWIRAYSFENQVEWRYYDPREDAPPLGEFITGSEAVKMIKNCDVMRWTQEEIDEAKRKGEELFKTLGGNQNV